MIGMDKLFIPSFDFDEGEAYDFRGWTTHVCVRCNCIRQFTVNEFVEHSAIRVFAVSIASTSRKTSSYLCQCDFCGFSIRKTPHTISPTCDTYEDFQALVIAAVPEGQELVPHVKLHGVFNVLSDTFVKHGKTRLPLRSNIGWIAAVFGVLTIGGLACFLHGIRQGHILISSELAYYAVVIIYAGVVFMFALGAVRLFARARFRFECKGFMNKRFRHLRQHYAVPEADIAQTRESLIRLL